MVKLLPKYLNTKKIMYLFSRVMCGIFLLFAVGFFIQYIRGQISLKLFFGYSVISAGLAYTMTDPIIYEDHEEERND